MKKLVKDEKRTVELYSGSYCRYIYVLFLRLDFISDQISKTENNSNCFLHVLNCFKTHGNQNTQNIFTRLVAW